MPRRKIKLQSIAELDAFDCTFIQTILENGGSQTRENLECRWSQNTVEYQLFRLEPLGLLEVERGPRGRITIAVSERGVAALFDHRKKHRQTIEYRAFVQGVPTHVEIYASMKGVQSPFMARSFYVAGAKSLVEEIVRTTWLWHLDVAEKEPVTRDEVEAQLIVNVKFPKIPKPASLSPLIKVEDTYQGLGDAIDHLWFFLSLAPTYNIQKVWMRLNDLRKTPDETILSAWEKTRELYYINISNPTKLKKLYRRNLGSNPCEDEMMAYNILFGTLEELYQKHKQVLASEHLTYRIGHAIAQSRSISPPAQPPVRDGELYVLTEVKIFRTLILENFSQDAAKYFTPPE